MRLPEIFELNELELSRELTSQEKADVISETLVFIRGGKEISFVPDNDTNTVVVQVD